MLSLNQIGFLLSLVQVSSGRITFFKNLFYLSCREIRSRGAKLSYSLYIIGKYECVDQS